MGPTRFSAFSRALERLADEVAGDIDGASLRVEMDEASLLAPELNPERNASIGDGQ